ncbi:MAG TPA: hypothetical protein V6D50_18920 [Chroococcales cyanobacterium]
MVNALLAAGRLTVFASWTRALHLLFLWKYGNCDRTFEEEPNSLHLMALLP